MFVFILNKDRTRINKYNCSEECEICDLCFLCYTRPWQSFRFDDQYGILFEQNEITQLPYFVRACCVLILTDDEQAWVHSQYSDMV